jgi:Raf kinase inhibitor-like YbhB/YbcL family protein
MRAMILAAAILATAAGGARATERPVAFDQVDAPATIQVSTPAIRAGGKIAPEFSGYGKNIPPAVSWTGQPAAAKAFVLFVQDPDSAAPQPTVHWVAYNIPGDVSALQRKTPNLPRLDDPKGMLQGPNDHGGIGYTGPHPPVGDSPHHYHIQVFALDRPLKLDGGAPLAQVQAAMAGHVLAKGQTVGLFQQAPPTTPRTGGAP